ncbi:MAG: ABC transporter permease [Candidatus Riflebacteria bacterium]|nr:ABC transporter permease [Candidatus Riflebacteria bacterium]
MVFRIERRPPPGFLASFGVVLAALALGMLAGGLLFAVKGIDPFTALWKIFQGSFGSSFGLKDTVTKAIPLILIGAGLCLAFRGRIWNIGAEGQLLAGAIGASGVALYGTPFLPEWAVLPAMFLAGAIGGAAWAWFPAVCRIRWGMNETITTLMLNYVAAELVQFLIYGPWKGKSQFGFPYTDDFAACATLPTLYGSRIHWPTLALGVATALALALLVSRSRFGFEVRVVGENPEAAHYAGMDRGRVVLLVMLVSGALAGLAGVGEVAGIHRHLSAPASISSGYGFTAIITAYLARLHPVAVIFTSLFFGGLLVGGDVIQTSLGLPFATVHIFNGMILFALLVGDFLLDHRVRRVGELPAAPPAPASEAA